MRRPARHAGGLAESIPAQPQDHHGEKLWDRLAQANHGGRWIHPAGRPDRPARQVRRTLCRQAVTLLAHHGQPAVTVTAIPGGKNSPDRATGAGCGDC